MRNKTVFKGLAGAAAMAGASQAYGAVVVVTPPATIAGRAPAATDAGTIVNLDLNGDGRYDIRFAYRNLLYNGAPFTLTYAAPNTTTTGAIVAGAVGTTGYAYALTLGTTVGATSPFYQKSTYFTHLVTNYNGTNYGFGGTSKGYAGSPEYIGFRFVTTAGVTEYGYAQVETDLYQSAANPGGLRFLKLAYDNSGAPIQVGAVPEPGTLGALAAGALGFAGIAAKRRRKAMVEA